MSTYDMMEKIPKTGPRDLLPRETLAIPYSYSRNDIEMTDGTFWRQAFRILRKHWKASLAFALILEFAVGLLVFSMENSYEARAVLDVEPPGADAIGPGRDASSSNTPGYLDTQTEILQSDGLALSVIDQLHLDSNPIFMKQTLLQESIAWLAGWFPTNRKTGEQRDTEKLVTIYRQGLTVGQVKGSQLVEVRYETRDPRLAAQIVNATVDQYLDKTYRSRYEATLRAAESLSPRLADLQKSIKKSTDALLDFQKTHEGAQLGSASPMASDGTTNAASAATGNPVAVRVSELNQQLTQAMGERLQQESYMKQIKRGNVDALPQMKDNVLIQGLTTRLVDCRAQLAQALGVYGGNNPQVRKLQLQADELNRQLDTERTRIARQIESAFSSAQNREQLIRNTLRGMKGELDQSNSDVMHYDSLKREADANANLYTTLSSRTKELAMSGSLSSSNIRLLDEARAPLRPDGPHRFRILGVGAMFGILGGVILAFAAENMNDTISSADDLRRWSGLPALALVPQISIPGQSRCALSPGKSARARAANSMTAVRANGLKFLTEKPNSPEADAIRNLETAIRIPIPSSGRPVQTVLITSALPGEGKTTVATNLALALARHGNTCLVDADFRHPSITPSFGLSQRAGLLDLLASPENSIQSILKPLPEIPNLTVIGVGNKLPDALETLTSTRMGDLVMELRKKFDYIVLDSPPVIPFSEGRWLSTLSDASILVARCDTTTRGAILWSLEILNELKSTILGVVLNGVDLDAEYSSYGVKDYASYVAK
jgi:succinoglycan biosynthesis transport protein ExoP